MEIGQDVLSIRCESAWYPDSQIHDLERCRQETQAVVCKANSLHILQDALDTQQAADHGYTPGNWSATTTALHRAYRPPWEQALQRWFDSEAVGTRSFARPSRRGADRGDVVLPGRRREGWALHVVLDTSGSMTDELPGVLGLLAGFCESAGVSTVHILQCDVDVTVDEWVEPAELAVYRLQGFGGSDLTPGLQRLAEDPLVTAVVVITDGAIRYPAEPPPYAVLWAVLVPSQDRFQPPYGQVIVLPPDRC